MWFRSKFPNCARSLRTPWVGSAVFCMQTEFILVETRSGVLPELAPDILQLWRRMWWMKAAAGPLGLVQGLGPGDSA